MPRGICEICGRYASYGYPEMIDVTPLGDEWRSYAVGVIHCRCSEHAKPRPLDDYSKYPAWKYNADGSLR